MTAELARHDALLDALLDDAQRARGWRPPFRAFDPQPGAMAEVTATTCLSLDGQGLRQPFVCGYVDVDFAARSVTFTEANLRDGYDERVDVVRPDAAWWADAAACRWPMPRTEG